jgi:hypothetical protein
MVNEPLPTAFQCFGTRRGGAPGAFVGVAHASFRLYIAALVGGGWAARPLNRDWMARPQPKAALSAAEQPAENSPVQKTPDALLPMVTWRTFAKAWTEYSPGTSSCSALPTTTISTEARNEVSVAKLIPLRIEGTSFSSAMDDDK